MKVPKVSWLAVPAVLAAALAVAALASGPAPDAVARAEAARVQLLAATCAACHGTGGQGGAPIPPLAGRPYEYLRGQLLAFKNNQAPTATIMTRLVGGYSEAELETLARHFSALPAGGGQ